MALLSVHLTHEPEALHNSMIQVYEFSFRQMIYVNAIHVRCRVRPPKLTTNAVSGFPPPGTVSISDSDS